MALHLVFCPSGWGHICRIFWIACVVRGSWTPEGSFCWTPLSTESLGKFLSSLLPYYFWLDYLHSLSLAYPILTQWKYEVIEGWCIMCSNGGVFCWLQYWTLIIGFLFLCRLYDGFFGMRMAIKFSIYRTSATLIFILSASSQLEWYDSWYWGYIYKRN